MNLRQKLRGIKLIRSFASIKLTVCCLLLLFILTIWGTVAQVHSGLYLAQQRYFQSFLFLALGFIPFPGGQSVMWLLFVNLISVALIRLVYKWRHAGIIIIHLGLLLFLFSGYITLRWSKESFISLYNGQSTNVSTAYHDWEISVWEKNADGDPLKITREVTAMDAEGLHPGQGLGFDGSGFRLTVEEFYKNCDAYMGEGNQGDVLNAHGIGKLTPLALDREPEKNIPGGIFHIQTKKGDKILLYGGESKPTAFKAGGGEHEIMLRLKRYPLPITLKLVEFMREYHPGTDTARSFKSRVSVEVKEATREKLISMNNPLRYKDYTFYQASFSVDNSGRESSTIAVVKNAGRFLPYVSTFVTFSGLLINFMIALNSRKGYEPPFVENV